MEQLLRAVPRELSLMLGFERYLHRLGEVESSFA